MPGRVDGKVAIVVGGGQTPGETIGNGRATALLLAREGARVVVVDRALASAQDTVSMIEAEAGQALAYEADATSEDSVKHLISDVVARFGTIDILHNNVGASIALGDARADAISVEAFDRSFAVTYLLEAIAMLVGLAGVAATFSAQNLARTKEFGMLRHIGVLRRQIVAMLAAEGALLGAVGVVAGIGLGIAISQVLIHVINPQSFHWSMETRLPLMLFAIVAAALILAAAGTALLAGRRALSADAVRAVREDW